MRYDQALHTKGSRVEDSNRFARRMTALMTQVAAQKAKPVGAVASGPEVPASDAQPTENGAVASHPPRN